MASIGYSKMQDDVGEPLGVVARRKANGSVEFTLLEGEDASTNASLAALIAGIEISGGIDEYTDMCVEMMAGKGADLKKASEAFLNRDQVNWKDVANNERSKIATSKNGSGQAPVPDR